MILPKPTRPEITFRYVGEELALLWVNPWSNCEEKIATFWWPHHPTHVTETVEKWFEEIAANATENNHICFCCYQNGCEDGCSCRIVDPND